MAWGMQRNANTPCVEWNDRSIGPIQARGPRSTRAPAYGGGKADGGRRPRLDRWRGGLGTRAIMLMPWRGIAVERMGRTLSRS